MVYVSRKVIYPIFILIFTMIFFSVIYMVFIYQPVEIVNPRLILDGDHFDLLMVVRNKSNHYIDDVSIFVNLGGDQKTARFNDCNCLAPGQDVNVSMVLPFPKDQLYYDVQIVSPFMRAARLPIPIKSSQIHPIEAKVYIEKTLTVGQTYNLRVDLKNISNGPLYDVVWSRELEAGYFSMDSVLPSSVNLDASETKPLYSTLTPINPGKTKVTFVLKVNKLEERFVQEVEIVPAN